MRRLGYFVRLNPAGCEQITVVRELSLSRKGKKPKSRKKAKP